MQRRPDGPLISERVQRHVGVGEGDGVGDRAHGTEQWRAAAAVDTCGIRLEHIFATAARREYSAPSVCTQ
jgi:hypothetical protein